MTIFHIAKYFLTIVMISFLLSEYLIHGFDASNSTISNGEFDRIMASPRIKIFQVLGAKIDFTRSGRLLKDVVIFAYIIPLSLVKYYPLFYLLGKTNAVFFIFLPLIGSLFLIPCFIFGVSE